MSTCANSQDPDEVPQNETFHQGLQCLVFKEGDTFFPQIITWEPSKYTVDIVCNFREKWKIPLIEKYIYNKLHVLLVQIKFNWYFAYSLCCQTDCSLSPSLMVKVLNSFHSGYR